MNFELRKRKPIIFAVGFDIMVTLSLVLAITLVMLAKRKGHAEAQAASATEAAIDAEGRASDADGRASDAEGRASDAEGRAEDAEGHTEDANKRADEAEGRLSAMQPGGPCDLVVVIDCTGSMENSIESLQKAMAAICQWIPYLSKKCRIGIVGMRKGVAFEFSIQEVKPAYADSGQSQERLLQFLNGLAVQSSPTDHLPCLKLAFQMMGKPGSKDHKQVCLLISDIGPCELEGKTDYSPSETAAAKRMVTGVQKWAAQADNRAFGSLYVGAEVEGGPSRTWFQDLSAPSGSYFYTDSSDVFLAILELIKPQGTN